MIRSVFPYVFVLGLWCGVPLLLYASVAVARFGVGSLSGEDPQVHFGLIGTILASPIVMMLMFARIEIVDWEPIASSKDLQFLPMRVCVSIYSFALLVAALWLMRKVFTDEAVAVMTVHALASILVLGASILIYRSGSRRAD